MDEYVGLPQDHLESYHTFMFRESVSHVHILNGNATDLIADCNNYEEKIKEYGGIEPFLGELEKMVTLLSMGVLYSLRLALREFEPVDVSIGTRIFAASRTRIKTLAYDTILANARFFNNDISAVLHMALTVGVATVLDSREAVVVVTGQRKALALSKVI
ncbi:glucosamine phosphate isomerase [Lentinula raphanica]|uniref:Glucosamine phosphate isomerase n=1 Tax=Lentinula raphanica TaxID=153919 RepID=A0AA38NYG8_9AGAR|nr:glucosamine phosphate isomerase [Lentinula raphanica]